MKHDALVGDYHHVGRNSVTDSQEARQHGEECRRVRKGGRELVPRFESVFRMVLDDGFELRPHRVYGYGSGNHDDDTRGGSDGDGRVGDNPLVLFGELLYDAMHDGVGHQALVVLDQNVALDVLLGGCS